MSDIEEALSYGAGLDRTVQDLTHAIGQDTLTLVYARILSHLTRNQLQPSDLRVVCLAGVN